MIITQAKQLLEITFFDALKYMGINNTQFKFVYEGIGGRFKSLDNSCEVNGTTLYINYVWANNSIQSDPYDLYYLMAHEARHIYQHANIDRMDNHQQHTEPQDIVQSWKENFRIYIRNEGPETFAAYVNQPVEVDANAFACIYCLIKKKGKPRIPAEADELTTKRLFKIAESNGINLQ